MDRPALVSRLVAERRLDPASDFAKTASLEALVAYAKSAPVLSHLLPLAEEPGAIDRYEALSAVQKHRLKEAEPERFEVLRNDWIARGRPMASKLPPPVAYEDFTGPERVELKASDPAQFEQLRNDWIARGQPAAGNRCA